MSQLNPYESPAEVGQAESGEPGKPRFRPALALTRGLLGLLVTLFIVTIVAIVDTEFARHVRLEFDRITFGSDSALTDEERMEQMEHLSELHLQSWKFNRLRALASVTLQFVTFIAFLVWVYVMNSNCSALGHERTFAPWKAVVWLLIPAVNLLMALPVMQDVAIGSDPQRLKSHKDPDSRSNWLAISWWMSLMVVFVCMVGLFSVAASYTPTFGSKGIMNIMRWQSVNSALQLLLLALSYLLVRTIWRNQQLRWELILQKA